MKHTDVQRDRAVGVLLATAAGDALGAGYEFDAPMPATTAVGMIGGGLGPFQPGEWTDDTSMAIAIAEIAATGADLCAERSLDQIVQRWHAWARDAKDVGTQTRAVLSAAGQHGSTAKAAREASAYLHQRTGRSAGNGSLMRTAPVALAYLDDEAALVEAARTISALTHFDPEAGEACVLWCTAIRHAVLTGALDVRVGLAHLDADRRAVWATRIDDAEQAAPKDFSATNGWVVAALQAAWSAIAGTRVPDEDPAAGVFRVDHLRLALESAVRGGGDTDTVAAIAGGLLGAAYGASAVPSQWRLLLKGWPGLTTRQLVQLADGIIDKGNLARFDTPRGGKPVRHPSDDQVWLGAAAHLQALPADVDAVVSLCRVADEDIPADTSHLDVRLIDQVGGNANLDFVLLDTVRAIEDLRAQGRTVFVHCVAAYSRTPTIAALYGARRAGIDIDKALTEVCEVLPGADPNPDFREALRRLHPALGVE
jgi:ADP-ribosyl-[dinitrogen reductase] hydrolase